MNGKHKNLELHNDFHTIINIAAKGLKVPIIVIALANNEFIELSSNHTSLNDITFDRTNSFLELCLTSPQTEIHQNILTEKLESKEKSYASTPLSLNGNKIGFIAGINISAREFSSDDILLLNDICEIVASTIEKHASTQKLQEVFNDFVHKMVHDLKNPFTTISLTTELLKRKADDAKLVSSFTQRLDNANDKVFKNLERLKSAFPLNKESFKLNIQEITLDDLILAVKQRTSLEITADNQFPEKIHGDHARLTEAIVQLINHLSLISQEMRSVSIKIYAEENQLQIAITNNNLKEMSVEVIENTESTALAISKKLIEMHYGTTTVKTGDASDNFSFYITLPLL